MATTKPIPVRIPEDFLPRIDAAAKNLGTKRATLILFCIRTFVADFEDRGKAILPPDWEAILKRLDSRTVEGRSNSRSNPEDERVRLTGQVIVGGESSGSTPQKTVYKIPSDPAKSHLNDGPS